MKKRFLLALSAIALYSVVSFTNCETLTAFVQLPQISLDSVELASISINGVELLCKLAVDNPNAFEIPFPETAWELFINTNSFTSGVIKASDRIRARQKSFVDVRVNLDFVGIFNSFMSLKGSQKVGYKIALGITFPISTMLPILAQVIGDKTWNFDHEGELPLPQLPKLGAPSMRLETQNITRAEVLVSMNIENPNAFPLPPITIKYDYRLNNISFLGGDTKSETIPPNSSAPVVFRLGVNYLDAIRILGSLFTSSSVSSSISLSGDFGIPAFRGDTFNLSASGTLPLR